MSKANYFIVYVFISLGGVVFASLHQKPVRGDARMVARWDVQQTAITDDLKTVCFVNNELGLAAGKNNTIIKTTDGGKSWKRVIERRENGPWYQQIVFSSPVEAWAFEVKTLLHTTDAGESWQPASKLPLRIDHGYGAGSTGGSSWFQLEVNGTGMDIYRTDDGGKSWRKAGTVPDNSYQDLFFLDAQHGWAVGRYLRKPIAYTTDGGGTWNSVEQQVSETENKIRFANATTGWAFGKNGSSLLHSTDGGITWGNQPTGLPDYRPPVDISIVNERDVFLCTTEAALRTANGGVSWNVIGNFRSGTISSLSFPSTSNGWVVGREGFVSHYHLVPQR